MSDTRDRARNEAAAWFTRLSRRAVTAQSLRDFREWRKDAANADAYAGVEQTWSASGDLAGDPDIRAATRAALARRPLRGRLRDALAHSGPMGWGMAGLVAVALAAVVLIPFLRQATYGTGTGEQRLVVLQDGSRVRLNTNSQIRVAFTRGERHIALLRGEAFFDVAHDAARPFLVDAGQADIRALGTRFDVRRDTGAVEVVLVEGKVRVRQDGVANPWTLAPNQQLTLAPGRHASPKAADTGRATSWTSGRLMFHETPLAEAVAEVNRYATRKVELRAPALASARVNGVFDTGDTEAFVAAVTMLFDLKAERSDRGDTALVPAAGA